MLNRLFSAITIAALLAGSVPFAGAATPPTVKITPDTLRSRLMSNNFGVLNQLNLIHQAKSTVEIARGNLLPKLNLGAIISGVTSGPAFALSAFSFLLPFLLPSNWANLHQSENLLESQKVGYRLVQLNNFASAYALYATILTDMAVREQVIRQYNDLVQIRQWVIDHRQFGGNVTDQDVSNADAQVHAAAVTVAQANELITREKAALAQMLDLRSAQLEFAPSHVPPSAAEALGIEAYVKKIQAVAPENTQVAYMIRAAQDARWSKTFGFLSGGSLSVGISNGQPNFGNLNLSPPSFSIGFDYMPTIQLASTQVEAVQIHARELLSQERQLAEAALGSMVDAKTAFTEATAAENEFIRVAQDEFYKYQFGQSDLLHVFQAEEKAAQAAATRLKTQLDLDQLRITLHRQLLSDQFASIKGCKLRALAEEKDRNFFRQLFRPREYQLGMDEACEPAN